MSDKKEDCFVSAMIVAFKITVLLLLILCGFSFIYYSEISLDSKISSFFGFISSLSLICTILFFSITNEKEKIKDKEEKDKIKLSIFRMVCLTAENFIKEFDLLISMEKIIEKNINDIKFEKIGNMYITNMKTIGLKEINCIFEPDMSTINQCVVESSKSDINMYESMYKIHTYMTRIINSTNFFFLDNDIEKLSKNYFSIIKEYNDELKKELSLIKKHIDDNPLH